MIIKCCIPFHSHYVLVVVIAVVAAAAAAAVQLAQIWSGHFVRSEHTTIYSTQQSNGWLNVQLYFKPEWTFLDDMIFQCTSSVHLGRSSSTKLYCSCMCVIINNNDKQQQQQQYSSSSNSSSHSSSNSLWQNSADIYDLDEVNTPQSINIVQASNTYTHRYMYITDTSQHSTYMYLNMNCYTRDQRSFNFPQEQCLYDMEHALLSAAQTGIN